MEIHSPKQISDIGAMLRPRSKHSASLINFEKAEEEKHTFNGLEPNMAIVAHYCVRS